MENTLTNQTKLLNTLKANFNKPESEYKDAYHLKDIQSNLQYDLYKGIDERANSIRSSAAMIYNTIGPDKIILDNVKYTRIEYEREFPALNNQENSDHDHSAHLDVSMISEDESELTLVEAKCLEWMDKPKSCSIAYLSDRCYPTETGKTIVHFKDSFRSLLSCPQKLDSEDDKRILPFYQKYDAIQMNMHILGI